MPKLLIKGRIFRAIGLVLLAFFLLGNSSSNQAAEGASLPKGAAPKALEFSHFPSRLHAFVWRNWELVPAKTLARVVQTSESNIRVLARSMGLPRQGEITDEFQERSYITVIRRNWHLLPYEQLLDLLGWTEEKLAFTLREDDFLYIKLGNLKPQCDPIVYSYPTDEQKNRAAEIERTLRSHVGDIRSTNREPLFQFVRDLSAPPSGPAPAPRANIQSLFSPRYCYSYFALYGDPLLTPELDPYPEPYLALLASTGVDGVWLQGILEKLAPAPWEKGDGLHEKRLESLRALVVKAKKHGIGVYLYLNEPRSKPLPFFVAHPELKGVVEGDHAALCSTIPAVQKYLRDAVASICTAVPELAGFFTISASENLSNCWSHHSGKGCPQCKNRSAAEVISEVNNLLAEGIAQAKTKARFIAWDWGWPDSAAEAIIKNLRPEIAQMSVSEWSLPIERGGVKTSIGEYSLSAIGPGPRATRHWSFAHANNHKTLAKVQMGNTWELSSVPYNPVVLNVAEHAANLRNANVSGLMLGWTLGGYPSPNLEVVSAISEDKSLSPEGALEKVALKRFGPKLAPAVVEAWKKFSLSFREFPFDGTLVYNAPMQFGPSNLLWEKPTGYRATMIGFPYDDLDGWRGPYPPEVFIKQFEKVSDGYKEAASLLSGKLDTDRGLFKSQEIAAFQSEHLIGFAAYLHFASTAAQARYIVARNKGDKAEMIKELTLERELAKKLYHVQRADSRIGFEATNHYYYVPNDLLEKILNCETLIAKLSAEASK